MNERYPILVEGPSPLPWGSHERTNGGQRNCCCIPLPSIMKKIVQNCNFSRCGPLAFSFHENFYSVYTRRCDFWSSSSSQNEKKITGKVSFNIASEASYVYILSGQTLIKNAKNGPFWRVAENRKLEGKQSYRTSQS